MKFPKIPLNKVSRFSQLIAVILFVAVFAWGFYLGQVYERHTFLNGLKEMHLVPAP